MSASQSLIDFEGPPLSLRPRGWASPELLGKLQAAARHIHEELETGRYLRRSELKAIGGDRFSSRIGELRAAGAYIVGPVPVPRLGIFETTEPLGGEDCYVMRERPRL